MYGERKSEVVMTTDTSARFEKKIDKVPFFISFIAIFAFILTAIISPDLFTLYMDKMQLFITKYLGWASTFFGFIIILFAFGIVVSPIGGIRIGGKQAKPDFSIVRWFSISLCSGIGIGILFWGIGEPMYHLMQPPANIGIEPGSYEAALFAIAQSAMHWSVAQYCIFTLCGVAFALMAFNEKMPLSIMSGLDPIIPKKHYTLLRNVINSACLFSICCGVISSTGALIMMISSSVSYVSGIPRGFMLNMSIMLIATTLFIVSSTTGLKRGMTFLATQNTRMFFFLLLFVFFAGPTMFILNMGTESFGYMLANFFRHSTITSTEFTKDQWASSWLVIYMAAFFAYGPPIGLYLARLGKGRTVRQFILMNVLAPSFFVFLWINTFGSLAIHTQWSGIVDVWQYVQTQGLESTVVAIIQQLPFGTILICIFIVVTLISFVTLVDPMTSVLATISTKGISAEDEAPNILKIVWGVNLGGVALAVVTLIGVAALKGMFAFGGVLMMFITIALCWCIVKIGITILNRDANE